MLARFVVLFSFCVFCGSTFAARTCYTPEDAAAHTGKDVCVKAHVYSLEQQSDGIRTLNVCGAGIANADCRFAIVSLPMDRASVGSLESLVDKDVEVRGTVHSLSGTSVILLSEERQLHGGPEKFRPNPALLSGFSAADSGMGFRDPSTSSHKLRGSSVFGGTAH